MNYSSTKFWQLVAIVKNLRKGLGLVFMDADTNAASFRVMIMFKESSASLLVLWLGWVRPELTFTSFVSKLISTWAWCKYTRIVSPLVHAFESTSTRVGYRTFINIYMRLTYRRIFIFPARLIHRAIFKPKQQKNARILRMALLIF